LRKPYLSIAIGGCAALLLGVWLVLAPTALGGSLRYVTTSGDSMEPAFRDGDLVLLRTNKEYAQGDVVAYRHPEFGIVLHRIVEFNDKHFIVKGDNNPTVDGYEPTSDEIVGAVWARIPGGGAFLTGSTAQWLRLTAGVSLGLFALIPVGIAFPTSSRRIRFQLPMVGSKMRPARFVTLLGPAGQALATALSFMALVGLLLAFVVYNRPLDRQVTVPSEYEQQATLSYSGLASGSVYSQGTVRSGDPVYRALVDDLIIQLNHEVFSQSSVTGDGDYSIEAIVQASDGWRRIIPLREQTPYSGTTLTDTVTLSLDVVDNVINDFRTQVGLASIDDLIFTVEVLATVTFDGTIDSEVVHTLVNDTLSLHWNPGVLYPDDTGDPADNSFVNGAVESTRTTANTVGLGFTTMSVRSARMVAQAILLMTVVGGLVVWYLMRRALQAPEPLQIAARYRSRIVPIQGAKLPTPTRVVALLSFDDLMRIADQKQEPILHFRRNNDYYYYVHVSDMIYRLRISSDFDPDRLSAVSDD
jgi:signal peptidase I